MVQVLLRPILLVHLRELVGDADEQDLFEFDILFAACHFLVLLVFFDDACLQLELKHQPFNVLSNIDIVVTNQMENETHYDEGQLDVIFLYKHLLAVNDLKEVTQVHLQLLALRRWVLVWVLLLIGGDNH